MMRNYMCDRCGDEGTVVKLFTWPPFSTVTCPKCKGNPVSVFKLPPRPKLTIAPPRKQYPAIPASELTTWKQSGKKVKCWTGIYPRPSNAEPIDMREVEIAIFQEWKAAVRAERPDLSEDDLVIVTVQAYRKHCDEAMNGDGANVPHGILKASDLIEGELT